MTTSTIHCTEDPLTLQRVAQELEELRRHDRDNDNRMNSDGSPFPRSCRKLLRSIPGNSRCIDCGNLNPDWASVTYGVLMCTSCSGRHRSYGVQTSRVRSVSMDAWSHHQVLTMLEGGNQQLKNFYDRHDMGEASEAFDRRYHTKAARFYRENMEQHVSKIRQIGQWMGRAASRRVVTKRRKSLVCARPMAIATAEAY